jgi:Zn-dependent protease with chaperone function
MKLLLVLIVIRPEEIDFIMGHEAGHIVNNDNLQKSAAASLGFFGSHLGVRLYNHAISNSTSFLR